MIWIPAVNLTKAKQKGDDYKKQPRLDETMLKYKGKE
jgi:hypothetical protein